MNYMEQLQKPFNPEDIEWRLQQCGEKNNKIWAFALAYVTNRAIMNRLDDVFGPFGWQNQFKEGPQGGVICGISVFNEATNQWITKWDGAENTDIESVKGGLSDSMKRAAVQWGIGRYLYNLESNFAIVCPDGKYRGQTKDKKNFKWNPPALPEWALPEGSKKPIPKPAPKQKTPQQAIQNPEDGVDTKTPEDHLMLMRKNIDSAGQVLGCKSRTNIKEYLVTHMELWKGHEPNHIDFKAISYEGLMKIHNFLKEQIEKGE